MTAPSVLRVDNIRLGILYMVASVFLFSIQNAIGKWLAQSYPIPMLVFFRSFIALLPSFLLVMRAGGLPVMRTNRLAGQFGRAVIWGGSNAASFFGYHLLPLADAIALTFAASPGASERVQRNLKRRRVSPTGDWHFWVQYADWVMSTSDGVVHSSDSFDTTSQECFNDLDGQKPSRLRRRPSSYCSRQSAGAGNPAEEVPVRGRGSGPQRLHRPRYPTLAPDRMRKEWWPPGLSARPPVLQERNFRMNLKRAWILTSAFWKGKPLENEVFTPRFFLCGAGGADHNGSLRHLCP